MPKRTSKDVNQMAKNVVDRIIELTEGPEKPEKNPAAVALGKLGGSRMGLLGLRNCLLNVEHS